MPTASSTQYVVFDWPVRGGSPQLADSVVYTHLIDAEDVATDLNREAKFADRANTFTVHAVDMDVMNR